MSQPGNKQLQHTYCQNLTNQRKTDNEIRSVDRIQHKYFSSKIMQTMRQGD